MYVWRFMDFSATISLTTLLYDIPQGGVGGVYFIYQLEGQKLKYPQ